MEEVTAVDRVAQVIRKAYTKKKRMLLDKRYTPDRTVKPEAWDRAAEVCISLNADPLDYVQACFDGCRNKAGPYANALGGTAARAWWKSYVGDLVERPLPLTDEGDTDSISLVVTKADERLEAMLKVAVSFMMNRTGHCEPTEENMYTLRMQMFSIPSLARVYFGYRDRVVMDLWAEEARMFILSRPDIEAAARRRPEFPIKELMSWK